MQKLAKHKPKTARRLLKKYSGQGEAEDERPVPQNFEGDRGLREATWLRDHNGGFEGDQRAHELWEDAQQEAPLLELQEVAVLRGVQGQARRPAGRLRQPEGYFEPVPGVWWEASTEWAQAIEVQVRI